MHKRVCANSPKCFSVLIAKSCGHPLRHAAQVANYRSFAEQRAAQLGRSFDSLFDGDTSASDSGATMSEFPCEICY